MVIEAIGKVELKTIASSDIGDRLSYNSLVAACSRRKEHTVKRENLGRGSLPESALRHTTEQVFSIIFASEINRER
jgi:hypothetical protein